MHQAPSSLKVSIITGGVKVINKGYHAAAAAHCNVVGV